TELFVAVIFWFFRSDSSHENFYSWKLARGARNSQRCSIRVMHRQTRELGSWARCSLAGVKNLRAAGRVSRLLATRSTPDEKLVASFGIDDGSGMFGGWVQCVRQQT